MEIIARRKVTLHIKVTGMNLGIGQCAPSSPVEYAERIAGQWLVLLQKGNTNSHVQLPRKILKALNKGAVPRDGLPSKLLMICANMVSVAPHFRE